MIESLVGRPRALGTAGALRSRTRVTSSNNVVAGRTRCDSLCSGWSATNTFEGERRWATDAGWAAWTRRASADVARLVNIATLIGKGTLSIKSATLARDELARLLFRHVLVVVLRHIGQNIYVAEKASAHAPYDQY